MIKEFKNWDNQIVTEQQLESLERAKIIYIDDIGGQIKRVDYLFENQLEGIYYYLNAGEDERAIVERLSVDVDTVIISNRQLVNNFSLNAEKEYCKGLLVHRNNVLYENNNIICDQPLDLITGQPIKELTRKYFYIENDFEILDATYKNDGSLEYINYKPDYDTQEWEIYTTGNFNELQDLFNDDLSYYLTSDISPNKAI